jgi:hypothetical protein
MALFTPSASPAVTVKEIDLTGVVPNVQTSTGAFVGKFGWGAAGVATLVSNEAGLVEAFSAPTTDNTVDFHSAAYFLKYSNSLYVVRQLDSASKNASSGSTAIKVDNLDTFEALTADSGGAFIAKYAGPLGNNIAVKINTNQDSDDSFTDWAYKSSFDRAPGTSAFVSARGGENDEIHVLVLDSGGGITGTPGTVLEAFPHLSVSSIAVGTDGTSNYYKDVLKLRSKWIYAHNLTDSDKGTFWDADSAGVDFHTGVDSDMTFSHVLSGGADSGSLSTGSILTGFDLFEDKDNIEVDFLIAPESLNDSDAAAVVNDLVGIAGTTRKDCVAVASPSRAAVVTTGTTAAVTDCNNAYTKSSYLVQDNNYLKVYDKYNDQYIKIPAASSTAGLMAATDLVAAPWFSPAGARRGRYIGITDIILSPNKSDRDTLYKAGINPIANIPGEGIMLFGDKTNESRPSAFDRINVRRLFLAIERAIAIAARNVLFEFNDEFTRAEFTNIVEPFLREIQGRRGITDFRVVCDETNNTPAVIDRNEFIANIFVKPARSINYVTLNFVAVRTGVEFEEVVGTV